MPQNDDNAEVSFTVPVKNDSLSNSFRTVHVIVPKANSDAAMVARPLIIILPLAAILVFILLKLKNNNKLSRALDVTDGFVQRITEVITKRF